jgi:hypothetical protein
LGRNNLAVYVGIFDENEKITLSYFVKEKLKERDSRKQR